MSKQQRKSPNNNQSLIEFIVTSKTADSHKPVTDKIYARNGNIACEMISDLSGGVKVPIDVKPA